MSHRQDCRYLARGSDAHMSSSSKFRMEGVRAASQSTPGLSARRRRVPRFLKVASTYGEVHLDLSRAVIEHPVVDIELHLGTGKARITVPRDAIVDIKDLRAVWKDPRHKPRWRSRPGGPRIRISGAIGYGRLKIRHARH
ncbi:hypothetical protein ACIPXV_20770 [Streptomyces libani]|uniref:hypothetical protein n=1 Tax=Streptomyces nigrescens TaxID=1920 RepID=UPI00380DED38